MTREYTYEHGGIPSDISNDIINYLSVYILESITQIIRFPEKEKLSNITPFAKTISEDTLSQKFRIDKRYETFLFQSIAELNFMIGEYLTDNDWLKRAMTAYDLSLGTEIGKNPLLSFRTLARKAEVANVLSDRETREVSLSLIKQALLDLDKIIRSPASSQTDKIRALNARGLSYRRLAEISSPLDEQYLKASVKSFD